MFSFSSTRMAAVAPQAKSRRRTGFAADSSYHPSGYGVSEGLRRARRPFLVRNIAVGTIIFCSSVGLYMMSIYKIKQDDFSDIASSNSTTLTAANPSASVTPPVAAPVTSEQSRAKMV